MSKSDTVKVSVSTRALLQRINRRLSKDGESVRKAGPEFFRISHSRSCVVDTHVDLVALGRELAVLRTWEEASAGAC